MPKAGHCLGSTPATGYGAKNARFLSSLEKPGITLLNRSIALDGLSVKVWPNGEFSVGAVGHLKTCDRRSDREDSEDARWRKATLRVHGLQSTVRFVCPRGQTAKFLSLVPGEESVDPLGLANASNSHKKRRGGNGLTSYGAKMLRNGVYLMEKRYGKDRLSFLTLTVPDLKPDDWESVNGNWSEILRQFFQWLRRKQLSAGLADEFVSCTEVQEERLEKRGEFALHIHCVFLGRKQKRGWMLTPKQIRLAWKRCLMRFLKHSQNSYQWHSVENVQRIKKSAEVYLSKYVSKGRKSSMSNTWKSYDCLRPRSWWNSSSLLKKLIKSRIVRGGTQLADYLEGLRKKKGCTELLYSSVVKIRTEFWRASTFVVMEYPVGLTGRLSLAGLRNPLFREIVGTWIC